MKSHIRSNRIISRCNAYSGTAHLYAAISVENGHVFVTNNKGTTYRDVSDDMKGGIIVFPIGSDVVLSDIKKLVQKHNPAGWTIGRFFKGCRPGSYRDSYSEDSLSVEITGVSDDALEGIGNEFCRLFNLKSILIKSYAERNRLLILG